MTAALGEARRLSRTIAVSIYYLARPFLNQKQNKHLSVCNPSI